LRFLAVTRSLGLSRSGGLSRSAFLAARRTGGWLRRSSRSFLLTPTLGLGRRLGLFAFVFLLRGLAASTLGLNLELVGLLDNGFAALRELDGWIRLVAGLLDLVAFVRGYSDVVRLDFVDFGRWMTTTPVPGR